MELVAFRAWLIGPPRLFEHSRRFDMGIRFACPNGHKLHVKEFLAGKRGVCPSCGARFIIPAAQPDDVSSSAEAAFPTSDADSPSVTIPTVEPRPEATDAALASFAAPPVVSTYAPTTPAVSKSAAITSASVLLARQRSRRRAQWTVVIALFVVAVIMAIVLVLVLSRNASAGHRRSPAVAFPDPLLAPSHWSKLC
jgi:hypothetical protein